LVVLIALYLVRPPGAGHVYRYRSDQYGLQGNTALLLKNRDCLVLSRSEADIGRAEAAPGSQARLFAIAGAGPVRSGRDGRGAYLVDRRTGRAARPGDAIDGEILFRGETGGLGETLRAGWPLGKGCGRGLAIVHSIARVHR